MTADPTRPDDQPTDDDIPPWHAYDGCFGCRRAAAIGRQIARSRT